MWLSGMSGVFGAMVTAVRELLGWPNTRRFETRSMKLIDLMLEMKAIRLETFDEQRNLLKHATGFLGGPGG